MARIVSHWWARLPIRKKVLVVLLVTLSPLLLALAIHLTFINNLLSAQQHHRTEDRLRNHVQVLLRLAVDIEDAFRGYLLTGQEKFLEPMEEAEASLEPTFAKAFSLADRRPEIERQLQAVKERLELLLESKHELIQRFRGGEADQVMAYVRSGRGLLLSNTMRDRFRQIEDTLGQSLMSSSLNEAGIARYTFWGLTVAVGVGLALGLVGIRLLTKSLTTPLSRLQSSARQLSQQLEGGHAEPLHELEKPDEIGDLARTFEGMAQRIKQHIHELESLNAIGHDINMIGPDGLDGVLRRITDRAVELLEVDICLVMVRNEQMQCWVVEAASGEWNDRLHKAVMLWEEFPVSVQAFHTKEPSIGQNLRSDLRPEVVRRNIIGDSMLSIPLLMQGQPFGVLVLLLERNVSQEYWNVRLAKGLAEEAALAIANARLYEAAHQKRKDLESRLRQLEHLAETLAHDLKAPGERMEELASMLMQEYRGQLDERAARWLTLISQNGKDLIERVEAILSLARIGGRSEGIEAVDAAFVIQEVLKQYGGDLERHKFRVVVQGPFPLVACHRAYLMQIFDNLVSNAIKFSKGRTDPEITVTVCRTGDLARFSVIDNGIGVQPSYQERVFEPFVRLSPGLDKGSGIGLAIVKRIVELYTGRVWMEANPISGCTVHFTLPVLGDLSCDEAHEQRKSSEGRPWWSFAS